MESRRKKRETCRKDGRGREGDVEGEEYSGNRREGEGEDLSLLDNDIWQYFGAKVPPVDNTHNVLLKKQKRTCSSLANGNNHQCTEKQVLEHTFIERPRNSSLFVFFSGCLQFIMQSQLLSGVHNPKSQQE